MTLLIQFLLRLSFGLAAGMVVTSARRVTSGYFRNNLYVMLGLTALAALLSRSAAPSAIWVAVVAAVGSYIGSVCWLYEKPGAGKALLVIVCLASLAGTYAIPSNVDDPETGRNLLSKYLPISEEGTAAADVEVTEQQVERLSQAAGLSLIANMSSGLLLGMTMAAMLLGHWYLNSPTMEIVPLQRLIIAMGVAVALQGIVSSLGLWLELDCVASVSTQWVLFVVLRWLFGLVGVAVLAWMAWETLKIPNTQSATGILYVAVIGTFVGETMALLLSRESLFPL